MPFYYHMSFGSDQNMLSSKRAKRWALTINNCSEFPVCPDASYAVYGKEIAPSTGTPHIQGYVEFPTLKSSKQIHEYFPTCHAEYAKGSGPQNRDYCIKDGDFQEYGVMGNDRQREAGSKRGHEVSEDWDAARKAAEEGRFEDIPSKLYCRYVRNFQFIHGEHQKKLVKDLEGVEDGQWAIWLYGPTGTGKSRWVKEHYPGAYYKNINKWWDGYQGEDCVCIEDVDPSSCEHQARNFKIWSDRYSFPAEVKGGVTMVRPKMIVVTSNYSLDDCFKDYEDNVALHRRFKCIYSGDPGFNPVTNYIVVGHYP